MTPIVPAVPSTQRRQRQSSSRRPSRTGNALPGGAPRERRLVAFTDTRGAREVVAQPGAGGGVLVVDRGAGGTSDRVLVALLFPEEPAANADLLGALYAADCQRRTVRCVNHEGGAAHPPDGIDRAPSPAQLHAGLLEGGGFTFAIKRSETGMSIPELRWMRTDQGGRSAPVSVRDVVAGMQSYEPVLTVTMRLLAHHGAGEVSRSVLRAELTRVLESPIVLNRRLRDAVLERIGGRELSMSEIAIRCGRTKRDRKGNQSGDTSWLARRVGLLPDAGQSTPTPWVHSDVLGLIARQGLDISPLEVEAS
jgi:hypothetical protein